MSITEPLTGSDRLRGRSLGVLLVMCGAIFLEGIDVGMLNVALPSIRADLGMSTGALQWVISAYVLGYGGFVLIGGRIGDLFGRRRVFLFWLVVFLLFSALGGLATEGWMVITARFVTGVAAAFMAPTGLAIITTSIPEGPQRNRALLLYAGTAAGGFSLGLVAGGLLTALDWRWVFFAPVLFSALLLLAAIPLVPADHRPSGDRTTDVAGAVTVTAFLFLLVLTVERATHAGTGWTIGTAAAALVFLAAFLAIERRSAAPMVRLGILRNTALVRANVATLLFAAGFFGFQFIVVLYLRELRGWSTLGTSLALLAIGIDTVLAPTVTPRLVDRFGNPRVIFGGLVLAAAGYALFLPLGADWSYAAMFPTMILLGLAFSLAYGPLTIAGTDGVDEDEQGLAGGLLYASFQIGAALGLAGVSAVAVAVTGTSGTGPELLDGYRAALLVPVAAAVLACLVVLTGLRPRRRVAEPELVSP